MIWVTLVASRLAGGLKSGLLEVMVLGLTVAIWRVRRLRLPRLLGWGSVAAALSITAAALVGGLYGTVQNSGQGSLNYIKSRTTTGTVIPAVVAVERYKPNRISLLSDFSYYGPKYAGFAPRGETISREVAVLTYGGSLAAGEYVSPVVISLPINLFLDMGYIGVLVGMLIWSTVALVTCRLYLHSRQLMAGVIGTGSMLWFRLFNNGGFAYLLLNFMGSVALLAGIVLISGLLGDSAARHA